MPDQFKPSDERDAAALKREHNEALMRSRRSLRARLAQEKKRADADRENVPPSSS